MNKATLTQYVRILKVLLKVLVATPVLAPLLGLTKTSLGSYLCPPLGPSQQQHLGITAVVLSVVIVVIYTIHPITKKARRVLGIVSLATAVVSGGYFGALLSRYVKDPHYPGVRKHVYVSIGKERSKWTWDHEPNATDEELFQRGSGEAEIQKMWTGDSIAAVRNSLWLSYTALLASLVFVMSLVAYQSASEAPPRKRSQNEKPPKSLERGEWRAFGATVCYNFFGKSRRPND